LRIDPFVDLVLGAWWCGGFLRDGIGVGGWGMGDGRWGMGLDVQLLMISRVGLLSAVP